MVEEEWYDIPLTISHSLIKYIIMMKIIGVWRAFLCSCTGRVANRPR